MKEKEGKEKTGIKAEYSRLHGESAFKGPEAKKKHLASRKIQNSPR